MGPGGPYNGRELMKHLPFAAFLLSTAFCVAYDIHGRREIAQLRREYAVKCVEVQRHAEMDAQVRDFQTKRARLQRWIDTINQIKTNDHRHVQSNVAAITTVDATPGVQAARVVDDNTVEVKTPSGVSRLQVKR